MRFLILIPVTLFLISCSDQDHPPVDGADNGGKPTQIEEKPKEFSWGELPCQFSRSCRNGVLNFSVLEWVDFFVQNFSSIDPQEKEEDYAHFLCGYRVQKKAAEFFHKHFGTNDYNFVETADFILEVIDPRACVIKTDVKKVMSQYFKKSKEYLYEIN